MQRCKRLYGVCFEISLIIYNTIQFFTINIRDINKKLKHNKSYKNIYE